jgi:RNA polymerase primary sigma factor
MTRGAENADDRAAKGIDEERLEERLIEQALSDLDDDSARTGAGCSVEDVDRTAERHRLSMAELVELKQRASDRGLIETSTEGTVSAFDTGAAESEPEPASPGDTLDSLFRQLRRYPLLDAADEIVLGRSIENGIRAKALLEEQPDHPNAAGLKSTAEEGLQAKQRMVASNVRLAIANAKSFRGQGLEFPDLVQAAMPGLIRAAEKFDHRKGFKFSTYATWWIRQSISRALANTGRMIRLPVHIVQRLNKFRRSYAKLQNQLGREPTSEEIAAALEWDPAEVTGLVESIPSVISLDAPVGDENSSILADSIPSEEPSPFEEVSKNLRIEFLREALRELSDRERRVLERRYGLEDGQTHTLDELGRDFGLTRERIRQIESGALEKLEAIGAERGVPA